MRKLLLCFSILLGISLCLVSCYKENKEIRIRILGESDTVDSNNFKYLVKEEVLYLLKKTSYLKPQELVKYLDSNLNKSFSNKTINVSFEDVMYPAKVLDGSVIPSGKYPTVLIKIGQGAGSNWWSILYPEFFGVSYESSSEVEYRSYFYELFK